MTTEVDIVNNALQIIGTRTTVTEAEYEDEDTNEAIQAKLVINRLRDDLLRMAPWDCGLKMANLTYISSLPGTPENTSAATATWEPGQPPPPWIYEYQYPVDCLKACWIVPQTQTGYSSSVPITTAVTGGAASLWYGGMPVRFKVMTDTFVPVISATVVDGGTGTPATNVDDVLVLGYGASDEAPIGAPVRLLVTAAPAGVVTTVSVISQVQGKSSPPWGGSYFVRDVTTQTVAQILRYGNDRTALYTTLPTVNLSFGQPAPQRVIVTDQPNAILAYVQQVTDPNVMDPLFQDAWAAALGSRLAMALTGNKDVANLAIMRANDLIAEARKADGNEGLTVNDVTPDWIAARGVNYGYGPTGPYGSFDWGGMFPLFS